MVLMAHPLQELAVLLLRAAGAIRVIHTEVPHARKVNSIVDLLVRGETPPWPPVTDNLDGWAPFGTMFTDLAEAIGHSRGRRSPLRLARRTEQSNLQLDLELVRAIPSLQGTGTDVRDICAAVEWLRTFFVWYVEEEFGDHVVIDIRGTDSDEWATSVAFSHLRGIVAMNPISPVWILQAPGQNGEDWLGLGDLPLFTEYTTSQYEWMMQVSLLSAWPLLYQGIAGLEMSDNLRDSLFASISPQDLPPGDTIGPRDIFGMARDDFPELDATSDGPRE